MRVIPSNNSFISYVFDFSSKEIGIINFILNKKLPETEKYGTPEFNTIFKKLSLNQQEQFWYPSISS
jgi:hypothetical protein